MKIDFMAAAERRSPSSLVSCIIFNSSRFFFLLTTEDTGGQWRAGERIGKYKADRSFFPPLPMSLRGLVH